MDNQTAADGPPAVVVLPAELDAANASPVYNRLCAAAQTGARVIVADLTATSFCDVGGVHCLLAARYELAASGGELRLALRPWSMVWRMLTLLQADRLLPVYFSVEEAASPPADAGITSTGEGARRRP